MAGIWEPWQPQWIDAPVDPYADPYAPQPPALPDFGLAPIAPPVEQMPLDPYAVDPQLQPGLGIPVSTLEQLPTEAPTGAPPVAFVDAISGGAAQEPTVADTFNPANPDAVGSMRFETEAEQASTAGAPLDPYAMSMPGSGQDIGAANTNQSQQDLDANMLALMRNDPHAFAQIVYQQDLERQNQYAKGLADAEQQNQASLAHNLAEKDRAVAEANAKSEQLDIEWQRIANTKIDRDRWWNSRSTGQHLANLIGSIAGGVMANSNGGRNPHLEAMSREIDRDIAVQTADIQNGMEGLRARKGIVAEIYARTGDLFQAQEAARIGALGSMRNELLARQQLFDPRGTQAVGMARTIAEVDGRMAAAREAAFKAQLDLRLKLTEEARKQREANDKHLLDAAKLAKQQAVGGSGRTKPRPILDSKEAFKKRQGIANWGAEAERMYAEEKANVARTQAEWDRGQRGGGSSVSPARPPGSVAAPGVMRQTASAPTGSLPPSAAAPTAGATEAGPSAQREYKSEDDWFEDHVVNEGDRKRYWFLDDPNVIDPVKLTSITDPEKFANRQRIRKQMGGKAGQLLTMIEKLQKRSDVSKATKSKISWLNDPELQEARALAEDLTGDVLQAKEMGVPSGTDIERVKRMIGGDPGGWQDPTANLQTARSAWQTEQDADWEINAPTAFRDNRYNRYRILPTASKEWVAKYKGRGQVKIIDPEQGNTDPKQNQGRTFATDAPDLVQQAALEDRAAQSKEALRYLETSGAWAPEFDTPDELSITKQSRAPQMPHAREHDFEGRPNAAKPWKRLRDQWVGNAARLSQYLETTDHDKQKTLWKAFKVSESEANDALNDLFESDPALYRKYVEPGAQYIKRLKFKPDVAARLTGEIIRSGGK